LSLLNDRLNRRKEKIQSEQLDKFDGVLFCHVTGASFGSRQEIIKQIGGSTLLRLDRDRRNEFDFHAVLVMAFVNDEWQEAGFVPSTVNKSVAQSLDAGDSLKVGLWRKNGGEDGFLYGLSITISKD